ncbi:class I SAM-dependent DNA methyltransferase [Castellaniella caeni]
MYAELEKSRQSEKRLKELLLRLQNLRIFDPACGSGNFLIIAYKELRKLEMEVINALNALGKQAEMYYSGIKLTQFYGIEIDDFARELASLSLWLAEHQMNIMFETRFGYAEAALPLRNGGHVVCANSLLRDWEEVCPSLDEQGNLYEVYICGNPPYLGARVQNPSQKEEMALIFQDHPDYKDLDYVSAWFVLASQYINQKSAFAFVSTSSLFQGEQIGYLWKRIKNLGQEFFFCHEPFAWSNNAKQNAGVFCVIVGIAMRDRREKFLFSENHWKKVHNISPYLVEGDDLVVEARSINFDTDAPKMLMGNMPRDGGHLILEPHEYQNLLTSYPEARGITVELYGSKELLSGTKRYAIWIDDCDLELALKIPEVSRRIEMVRDFRLNSKAKTTNQYAKISHQFAQRTTPPSKNAIIIPAITSGRRDYVPIFWFDESKISTNKNYVIPNGTLYDFALLQSEMHLDWMRVVVGRNGSGYSYSINVVYNTFPRPTVNSDQKKKVEALAEEVLLIREEFPDRTPADLYDPDKMPAPLLAAHKALDRAVEALYRDRPFRDASERLEHLFNRYEKLIAEEQARAPAKKTRGGK